MKLDKSFLDAVSLAICATWGGIAPDANVDDDNDCAIELVINAGRMSMNGYGAADDKIGEAIAEHGWQKVSRYLSRNIQLV